MSEMKYDYDNFILLISGKPTSSLQLFYLNFIKYYLNLISRFEEIKYADTD